jgi:UDP-N-acetylglucosamine transferase subunit ALG13
VIFVTVGTTDFDPLVEAMDRIAGTIEEPVTAQTGRGVYAAVHLKQFPFVESLEPHLREARIVVSHGGLATIIEVLKLGRPLVAISNPDRYDRHQDDILRAFSERDYLLWCLDLKLLPQALEEAGRRRFAPYEPPSCEIARVIRGYLGLDGSGASGSPAP